MLIINLPQKDYRRDSQSDPDEMPDRQLFVKDKIAGRQQNQDINNYRNRRRNHQAFIFKTLGQAIQPDEIDDKTGNIKPMIRRSDPFSQQDISSSQTDPAQ
jgi:hypothetical protein